MLQLRIDHSLPAVTVVDLFKIPVAIPEENANLRILNPHCMNKIISSAALLLTTLLACNSNKTAEQTTTTSPATTENVELPMEMSYKGKSEIGSTANIINVMKWNKYMGEKNLDSAASLLADSVHILLADGTEFNTTRDSMKIILTGYLHNFSSISINYVSAVPINVKMANGTHEWVLSWTDETYSMGDGTTDRSIIHEDYRLENGKIREVFQYARKAPAPPGAKK
jgi:hypothetical protein